MVCCCQRQRKVHGRIGNCGRSRQAAERREAQAAAESVDLAYRVFTEKIDSERDSLRLVESWTMEETRTVDTASPDGVRSLRVDESGCDGLRGEAPPGFEPGIADLQSAALPLGEGALNLMAS